ncbi:hypothetical protein Glove_110g127 [Diversispora epigaea]|uniref:TLDc domain-containing protein n=1 Tax=Diversispora epigaea TaxID=1348612 RepID=A0A397J665_9GLOM|nr:hypothetical protein Glove_110g127 [Diversispora epigaea]
MSLLKRDDLQIEEIKISGGEFHRILDKLSITKKFLINNFGKDINQHKALPDRPIKSVILPPRTTLITELLSPEISINYSTTNNPYDFQLILHGTRDRFVPQTIWNICHGHSNTVFLTKVTEADEIIGGYNLLARDRTTNDSFIFSLKIGIFKIQFLAE